MIPFLPGFISLLEFWASTPETYQLEFLIALTKIYQFYYDVLRGGEFSFKLEELHTKYGAQVLLFRSSYSTKLADQLRKGPVIRVNPDEVYINDPEFIDEVYAGPTKKREKSTALAKTSHRQ